jgi:sugar phosphate permease
MILPLGGIVGMLAGGWSSERFFGGRRVPVIVIFLLMLGCLTLVYGRVAHWGSPWTEVTLGLIGFSIYGPQLLLVGTTPVDLARGGTFAAAAGFVNFLGYMGAALGDQLTGGLKDVYKNWDAPVYFWAACAFGAAISAAFIWNAGGSKSSGAAVDETIREGEDSS